MISEEKETQLQKLLNVFQEENSKLNLSALRDEQSIWIGNILDSLPLLELFPHPLAPSPDGRRGNEEERVFEAKKPIGNNILSFAREMRKEPTKAEEILWEALRDKKLGFRFRRQHPVAGCILDFYCHEVRLAIEADGGIHNTKKNQKEDIDRDEALADFKDIRVLRFTNEEIESNLDEVLLNIQSHLKISPPPSEEGSGVGEVNILDIGTGGGFPLLPLAICKPDWKLTGLDSTQKKLDAIRRMADQLNLTNVELISGRAEELGHDPKYREQYDIVTARALAPLNVLLEFCSPFVKKGGFVVAWKSMKIETEMQESLLARAEFSCHLEESHEYELPEDFGKRQLLIFKKTDTLNKKYPREIGIPKKNPLI